MSLIEEPLIKFNNKSDFELLLFAQSEVKELKKIIKEKSIEIGVILSERDELKYKLNKYLNQNIKGDWKRMYHLTLKALKRYRKVNKQLREDIRKLIYEKIHYKTI